MREIKFRAFDTYSKKFTNYQICDDMLLFYDKNKGIWLRNIKERYILLQYTGMRDHKGVEIYEGDIVSMEAMTPGAPSIVGEIQFEESCYWVVREKEEKAVRLFQEGVYIEKIGNIYENSAFYNGVLKGAKNETKA